MPTSQEIAIDKALAPPPPRELPIALAQQLARTRPTDYARQEILKRLFHSLTLADQIMCQAELQACRAARRGGAK